MKARTRDRLAATPLALLCGLGIAGLLFQLWGEARALSVAFHLSDALMALSQAVTVLFLGLQLALLAVRRLPEAKAQGLMPTAAAILGLGLPAAFGVVPRVAVTLPALGLSTALVTIGTLASIYVLATLGRSFAILPQARGLVTSGPYKVVRHPLYLAEQVVSFGVMLQFAQPWALLVALAALAAQWPRMHYEERVLAAAYPAYRAYMSATSRIIPGLY